MTADGSIVEIEEQVAFDSLPADVKAGLLAKAGKGKTPESRISHQERQAGWPTRPRSIPTGKNRKSR